jgi:hypothetical protein
MGVLVYKGCCVYMSDGVSTGRHGMSVVRTTECVYVLPLYSRWHDVSTYKHTHTKHISALFNTHTKRTHRHTYLHYDAFS